MRETYDELEHTADWAIRVTGSDRSDLFMKAAGAMLDLMQISLQEGTSESREIGLAASDVESLLVSWLEEIIFIIDTEHNAPLSYSCKVRQDGLSLEGTIQIAPILSMRNAIKAVTYNELNITQTREGFVVQIVFDV